ncbi:MAG TPA: lipopolysaccharide assembly protein LapA domain-containing protein [Steroidobacteraceae bacterium]|nr:lipopolysaccharide assembly protein LapA domain-containing protein [Steroidobacteraceae bacterium]
MTRRLVAAILFALLALVCAGFVRLNSVPTRVDLYFATLAATAGQALVVAFIAGWLVGVSGALAYAVKLARERAALARALKLAEGEVRTLRATQPAHAR